MLTQFIALAVGGYALAAGIGFFTHPGKTRALFNGLKDNAALTYLTGVLVYAIGALILLAHWRWGSPLEIAVTLIGIGAVVEGLAFLVGPGAFLALFRGMWENSPARVWAGLAIIFGAILIGAGVSGL